MQNSKRQYFSKKRFNQDLTYNDSSLKKEDKFKKTSIDFSKIIKNKNTFIRSHKIMRIQLFDEKSMIVSRDNYGWVCDLNAGPETDEGNDRESQRLSQQNDNSSLNKTINHTHVNLKRREARRKIFFHL